MAVCVPFPTLTLFATTTSTTVITTAFVTVQTQPDGSVSTVTIPEVVTSLITIVNPTSTLYASCSSSSTPINTISYASPQPSPTIVVVTVTPGPTVITQVESSTLGNGVVTVFTTSSTFTPSPTVVLESTTIASTSNKSSSNIGPIAGGAAGGFLLLLGVVFMTWFILKKCRKPDTVREEEDVVFPYPVTRDRDQSRRLDLNKESRPYVHGLVGRSTQMTAPGSSPAQSDGRPDSATDLIGTSTTGLTPMASASGNIATIHGALSVGRQSSYNSTPLPLGAAPPDHYSHSAGSISGASSTTAPAPANPRPLQVINSPPMPLSGSSSGSGAVPGSHSIPFAVPEQSAWPEKSHARGPSSSTLSSDTQFQGRPSGSGLGGVLEGTSSAAPGPIPEEPTDAPPAYVA